MRTAKPLVCVAAACERVLLEKDGVASIVRLVDTFRISEPPPGLPVELANITFHAFISLKSGEFKGEGEIELRVRTPDGTGKSINKWSVLFNGGEHGVNMNVGVALPATKFGLYWIDVVWAEEVLTSIPINLVKESSAATVSAT